jgi:hypothetical protein
MLTHPSILSELAPDRQRQMLASAEQQRPARRYRAESRATRYAGRRIRRALRAATWPRTVPQA